MKNVKVIALVPYDGIEAPMVRIVCESKGKPISQREKLLNSKAVANLFRSVFNYEQIGYRESFYVLYLNRQNKPLAFHNIGEGGMSSTIADIKIILKGALDCGASGVISCHNHPSGNLKPSQADIDLARRLKEAARIMDLTLLDNMILSGQDDSYYSFGDEGIL